MPTQFSVSGNSVSGNPFVGAATPTGGLMLGSLGCCCGATPFQCGNCSIPKKDLTLDWSNEIIGDGSTKLLFNGTNQWASSCTHQVLYLLFCNALNLEFRVIYFISGACPNGQSNFCSTFGNPPLRLNRTSLTCGDNFDLEATVTNQGCPNLFGNGYTSFSIHT